MQPLMHPFRDRQPGAPFGHQHFLQREEPERDGSKRGEAPDPVCLTHCTGESEQAQSQTEIGQEDASHVHQAHAPQEHARPRPACCRTLRQH